MIDELIEQALGWQCCKRCVPGSFEEAYHKMQYAGEKMNDLQFMFEAGKRSERLVSSKRLHKMAVKAIKESLEKVYDPN